jgi:molybdopterin-guanine dinucleotide biosynthesis protein A
MQREATGIILAGGASRRMGRDKSALEFGGLTSLERVAETVSRVCDQLVVVSGRNSPRPMLGLAPEWLSDPPGMSGPLAGLAAGLQSASHEKALVVACDMPFLSEELLTHLLDLAQDCDAAIPVIAGTPQPLHAAYSRDSLRSVSTLLRLGARSMRDLMPRLRVRYLDERRCRELDPGGLSWFNMNTPEDYRFALNNWPARSAVAAA